MEIQTGYKIIICFFSVTDQSVQYTACQKQRGARGQCAYIIIYNIYNVSPTLTTKLYQLPKYKIIIKKNYSMGSKGYMPTKIKFK